MATHLSIQQMAAHCGLTPHTLRYYERIGLIHAVARDPGGRRRYVAADLEWVRFLTRLRATGMTIADMLRYAAWRREGAATVGLRRALLEEHLGKVRDEIAELQAVSGFLAQKVALYRDMERVPPVALEKENHHARRNPKRIDRTTG